MEEQEVPTEHLHEEIHERVEHSRERWTLGVALSSAFLAGFAAVAALMAGHYANEAMIHQIESSDQWSYYQAKKIREYTAEVGQNLLETLGTPDKTQGPIKKLEDAKQKYISDAAKLKEDADKKDAETELEERRALRFDIGEGLLELGLVLCSLYFLARKPFFPVLGVISSVAGALLGIWGALLGAL